MSVWEIIRFALCAVCALGGLFVYISGVVGIFRFRYALSRIHAAALLDSLGMLLMVASVVLAQGLTAASGKMVVALCFLWLTSPVASHLVGRLEVTINDHLEDEMDVHAPEAVLHEKDGD